MTTLQSILDATAQESTNRQKSVPLERLQEEIKSKPPTRGFYRVLKDSPFGIIAEIKRKSPSMGNISGMDISLVAQAYNAHPAVTAISVLTQNADFGGSPADLELVRTQSAKPILRKDFVFTEYEVYYSRWIGADAILLMANVVTDKSRFEQLHELALSLGLDVLCEIHEEDELSRLPKQIKLCGINARKFKGVEQRQSLWAQFRDNLSSIAPAIFPKVNHDLQTNLNTFELLNHVKTAVPASCLKVAESGISASNVRAVLERYDFNAALIGTSFLKGGTSIADISKQLDETARQIKLGLKK